MVRSPEPSWACRARRAARLAQDQKLVDYVHGLGEDRLAEPLDYATSSGAPQSQPLHHVLAHLFNHQTRHRGQAHHLVGLALGREATPVLDLLAYQRSAAAPAVEVRQGTARPHNDGPPGRPLDDPRGPDLAATRVQAANAGGERLADKEVPEPDSLGGKPGGGVLAMRSGAAKLRRLADEQRALRVQYSA